MRRRWWMAAIMSMCLMAVGCASVETFNEMMWTLRTHVDEKLSSADEAITTSKVAIEKVDEALDRVGELITEAEKDESPEVPGEPNAVATGVSAGSKAIAPLLPPPWNVLVPMIGGMAPFFAAWLQARGKRDKRTAEERLLVAGLQGLKKNNREMFDKFIEYRDKAAVGVLTARELADLLEGINQMRTTITG